VKEIYVICQKATTTYAIREDWSYGTWWRSLVEEI